MKRVLILFAGFSAFFAKAQVSIHQEQSAYYGSLGLTDEEIAAHNHPQPVAPSSRAACDLNKIVYGWHPYWSNGLEANYDWNLLSHFCYFSYELDPATGNATSTHNFSTASSVTTALANGVRVDLCVTLFSGHATFLTNATARQNLINNLISLISARGAHGVNIDFEGLPLSQKANFTSFMNDLADQMHMAIPGSQVSSVLYAVDWNDVLDVAAMTSVDFFVIMGYDYYYSGSTTAGPNDPLFHFGTTYNYTLSRSVTYYLDKGLPASKLVLGLPYYGREWSVASTGTPASTTSTGVARTFSFIKDNTSGNYSAANRNVDNDSYSAYYEFTSGSLKQCFITETGEMNARLDFINKRGIAGMGIWALGYDDGYTDFWDAIGAHMTDCAATPCTGNVYDIGGGAYKNYYNNEDYTFTLSPPGASSVTVNFTGFDLENGYDYLYVYNGSSTAAPQFPGSPFTGTGLPPALTSTGGHVTFRFTSDGATIAPGFTATYTCTADTTPPVTTINLPGTWQTSDFNTTFTDTDNTGGTGVNETYYQVLDHNGSEWRGNASHGFFNDHFDTAIHPEWTPLTGTWNISSAHLQQADNAETNSNIYASLHQDNAHQYLYQWQMNMTGTGSNRRAGLHFFCDDATLPNRGNSYFVYFRVDSDKCQIYKVTSDVYTLMTDDDVAVDHNTWYDCKVTFDPQTGSIRVHLNDRLVSEWIDPLPLNTGNSLSLRTGGTSVLYDDVKVYTLRTGAETVTVGNAADQVRYENSGPAQPACRIVTTLNDSAGNWSDVYQTDVNIDWTEPSAIVFIADSLGTDIDVQVSNNTISAHYSMANDPHSGILEYQYSVGTSAGDSSVLAWTGNGPDTFFVHSGLSLAIGQTYFVNVRARNGADLLSNINSSDGVTVQDPGEAPNCVYTLPVSEVCITDSVQLDNTTTGATGYNWSGAGIIFSNTSAEDPYVHFPASGTYTIQLVANGPGGTDTLTQNVMVTVYEQPVADFTVSDDTLYLPSALLACTNTSLHASAWNWDFGDGNISNGSDPWNSYTSAGVYTVVLAAANGFCAADTASLTIVVLDATGLDEVAVPGINIYPNPVSQVLQVTCAGPVSCYEIYGSSGRLVLQSHGLNTRTIYVPVQALSPGQYYLRVEQGGIFTHVPFIKK